jgi:hypothetical protein
MKNRGSTRAASSSLDREYRPRFHAHWFKVLIALATLLVNGFLLKYTTVPL